MNQPKTFEELMSGDVWLAVLDKLRTEKKTIRIATSEEAMGSYCEVILDNGGFKLKRDKGALQAAFAKSEPTFRTIDTAAEVLELIGECDSDFLEEQGEEVIVVHIILEPLGMFLVKEITGVDTSRPFHETIVEAIDRCPGPSSDEILRLLQLIKDTKIPHGHDKIIETIDTYFDFPGKFKWFHDIREVKENLLQKKKDSEKKKEERNNTEP